MLAEEIEWLPELHLLNDYHGKWDEYFEAAYDYFVRDFITSMPMFQGFEVRSKRHEAYQGMDHSFWHCIEEKSPGEAVDEENRIPKIALCERIRWPRPIIEHAIDSPEVLAWSEIYRGHGSSKRVHLLLNDERYVVVLEPRGKDGEGKPRYYYLWTTFLCEGERQYASLLKRYERGDKMH